MDPITHGLLGAAAARAVSPTSTYASSDTGKTRALLLLGAVAGMLPDADVVTRWFTDPALPWEAHRHFTHAVAFAPVGGLLAALPFFFSSWCRRHVKTTLAASTLAYATHGFLDACTSYGTRLWLPFSTQRAAWDIIAIIDPLFTALLLAGVLWTFVRGRVAPVVLSLLLCLLYLGFGASQHHIAMQQLLMTAQTRGHTVEHARAMPTPANLVVWRALYVADGRIHADAVRVPWIGAPHVRPGDSVELFRLDAVGPGGAGIGLIGAEEAAELRRRRVADVVERFDDFTDGFLARDPLQPEVLADMRYSVEAASFAPLWGIRLNSGSTGEAVSWVDLVADRRASLRRMWSDLRRR